uniref:Vps41 beta-propeller domain-containing protein n=1 Tax=Trichobilharzia regenti TaxID=157069 RepID=A0AA85JUT9_TRIRE|nr:unnamed protein product [Trichobilharzia regenti]
MPAVFEVAELAEDLDEEKNWEPVEPCLKYKPLKHGLCDITAMDSISCVAVHEKFIAVGTEWGRVHLLDHSGFPVENGIHSVFGVHVYCSSTFSSLKSKYPLQFYR